MLGTAGRSRLRHECHGINIPHRECLQVGWAFLPDPSPNYNQIAGSAATGGTDNLSNGYSAASQLVLDGGNYTMV